MANLSEITGTESNITPSRPPGARGGLLFGLLGAGVLLALAGCDNGAVVPPAPMNSPVADFALTNQDGKVTTLSDLSNHVWVADIIFTRCTTSCPIMTSEMKTLQDALPADSQARLVSLTTNPDFDQPPVLAKYAAKYQADSKRWVFLTGTRQQVAAVAGDSLKLGSVPIKPEDRKDAFDFFIHTTLFVVVDKHGNLRQAFESTGENIHWDEVKARILATVKQLESQP